MGDPKIVITGTGRAGTTLLVQILDALGLDTGIDSGRLAPYMPGVRAGLESRIDDPEAPTVVKDMTLGFRIRDVLDDLPVTIGHVIIPTRRLDIATASRVRAADYGRLPFRRGALTGTMRATEQEQILAGMQDEILSALGDHDIPYTVIEFPRFATDASYAFEKLSFVAPDATVDDFRAALDACVRPDLIHEAPLSSKERWRMRAMTAWMRWVRFPIAAIRRRIDPEGSEARLKASVAEARQRDQRAAEQEAVERASGADRPPIP